MDRNVEIITRADGKKTVRIKDIRFKGKQDTNEMRAMDGIDMTRDLNYRYLMKKGISSGITLIEVRC